jgi:low temperature requirement protein LtrA
MSGAADEAPRVTTLELFFDLVFVFTITQLTTVLFRAPNGRGLVQVVEMLGVIWWMYGGYVWMTNAVRANTSARRLLLLGGMGGFFVLSLAIPTAFAGSGLAFGLAYLVVVLVHSILFTRATAVSAARAILTLAPFNVSAALVVVAGGALGGRAQYVLWGAAAVFEWLTPKIRGTKGFVIAAGHFVERHALVVIIAIGESIVAIGVGLRGAELGAGAILVAVLGLCVAYYLWWFYFAGDDERAEHVLARTPPAGQTRLALHSYGYAHIPMMLGIIVVAVGIHKVAGHPFEQLHWGEAITLSGGVALYLAGHAAFLWVLGLRGVRHRLAGAAVVLAAVPLGHLAAIAQLAALPIIMSATAIIEDVPEVRRTGRTEISTFGRTTSPSE